MSHKQASNRYPTAGDAFSFFCEHIQHRTSNPEEQKTRHQAVSRWNVMTDEQRAPWYDYARRENAHRQDVVSRGIMDIPARSGGASRPQEGAEPRVRSSSDPSEPQVLPYSGGRPYKDDYDMRTTRPDNSVALVENPFDHWVADPRASDAFLGPHRGREEYDELQSWNFGHTTSGYQMNVSSLSPCLIFLK